MRRNLTALVPLAALALACSSKSGAGPDGGPGGGGAGGGAGGVGAQSVLTRGGSETREGFFIQPALTKAAVAKMAPDTAFQANFDGLFYGAPLYVEKGPQGKGAFFVATTSNNVYALDETTGAIVWTRAIGNAPANPGVACGNVKPVGATGTSVIDGPSRTMFVALAVGDQNTIMRHEVHALSIDDGTEKAGWPVNVSAVTAPGGVTFNSPGQNQRSSLSLVKGVLYVPYGGHAGDCGSYRGWIVAIDIADPTKMAGWATGGVGEGIWHAAGMASDGNGVFAVTGNRLGDSPTHQDSEEVVRVTGMAEVDRATGIFFPSFWRTMDQTDADFGASSPVVIRVPGSTPQTMVAAVTKDGHFYLLDAAKLGGMDGFLAHLSIAPPSQPMSIRTAPSAYTSSTGVHVVLTGENTGGYCPAGSTKLGMLSLLITPGAPATAKVAWCASGDTPGTSATSPDGKTETVVWHVNKGVLEANDGDTGELVYSGGSCSGVKAWTAPIAVKGRIVVGGDGHLCSWSPH